MPVRSLRVTLPPGTVLPSQGTNLGLWFQKYLDRTVENPSQKLIDAITELPNQANDVYKRFYNRWLCEIKAINAVTKIAKTHGRMIVNLGADSVAEVSIALHHTYGIPYIPGTALKGLAAHYANSNLGDAWKKNSDFHQAVFGTGKAAGYVTFHDALFVPDSSNKPLQKDVVTGHHQDYNKGDNVPPADWDRPTIIPFISVNGKFLIAISGDENVKPVAMEILLLALLHEGIGAKTSSGYGRMVFETSAGENGQNENSQEPYELTRARLLKEDPPIGYFRGYVKNVMKGGEYGFITPQGGGKDIFVHMNALSGKLLKEGQVLDYKTIKTNKGLQATEAKILLEKK